MAGGDRGGCDAEEVIALDDIFRDQAAAAGLADAPIEHVAARVTRTRGLSNRGLAASGHVVPVDEPAEFGGTGAAADPAELLLIAVGASLSVTLTVHAALAGIALHDVHVALTGKLDPKRFFAPADAPGGGFYDLAAAIELVTPADRDVAQALVDRALLASPVLRSIAADPAVTLTVRTK